jgi:L-alanine-DL-glutamate epimerase-like enolase superfamily enzyme
VFYLNSTDFNSYGPKTIATTTAHRKGGRLSAPHEPGLGVELCYDVIGKPVFEIQ